jgi:hypothetical protein
MIDTNWTVVPPPRCSAVKRPWWFKWFGRPYRGRDGDPDRCELYDGHAKYAANNPSQEHHENARGLKWL